MLHDVTLPAALLAGLISFLSPCVLPLVPPYLIYLTGATIEQVANTGDVARSRRAVLLSALLFVLGFSPVFVALGASASLIGAVVRGYSWELSILAGIVIIIMGLHFLGLTRIGFLMREARMESKSDPTTILGAYVMGLAFGFGWTACVGPVLATILMIASGMGEISHGALLLAMFGLGMTAPFVIAAFFARPFLAFMMRHRDKMQYVEKVMGVMLIVFAILIATDTVNIISNWMIEVMPSFQSLG